MASCDDELCLVINKLPDVKVQSKDVMVKCTYLMNDSRDVMDKGSFLNMNLVSSLA